VTLNGQSGSDIGPEDIDRLCAAVERGNQILIESSAAEVNAVRNQTKSLEIATLEGARSTVTQIAGALDARRLS
jgi:hypothetical protein